MNSKRRKAVLVALAVILCFGFQSIPMLQFLCPNGGNLAYANIIVDTSMVGATSAVQGDQNVVISVKVENNLESNAFTFDEAVLDFDDSDDIAISGGTTAEITLEKGNAVTLSFYLNVGKYAETGTRKVSLKLINDKTVVHEKPFFGNFTIYEKLATPSGGAGTYVAALDITHEIKPAEGFSIGTDNNITFKLFNNGNSVIKNATLTLTMPEGLSVNNASNSFSMGYISTGSRREVTFPITVSDDAVTKTYAIEAKITGLSYSNAEVSISKTFYIPVTGTGSTSALKNLEISNISIPNQVAGKEDFTLSFRLNNRSSSGVKNLKVYVAVPEGILNKTRDTFIEASIPAGGSKDYSITLFAEDPSKEKTYSIKIAAASAQADSADSVVQYTSVYVKAVAGNSKTPQLMVDRYNYGGTYVQAGDDFLLDLGLYNTSATHTLTNIKVTVSSEDGTIIPVNSSNSFFVDGIGTKEHVSQALHLSVKPTAEQKTTALTVDMSYEDGSGNAFTSKDVISIPVMQDTRLEVDDVIAPPELYVGMQSGVSVQFYNMGKTVLNNLRVTAEGNFDTMESTSYFVGNMESGKSDSYDFSFIPREAGSMEGKIIFTYEDASGNEQVYEKPFAFEIMGEMPVFDEGMMPVDEAGASGGKGKWIALGVVVLLIVGGIIGWKKFRKRKINREMEIDE